MVVRLLSYLFRNDSGYNQYIAHPVQLIWAILIMAVGWTSIIDYRWMAFGVITFIFGVTLGIVIQLAILWDKSTRDREVINEHISLMLRVKNPDIIRALGYNFSPETITIVEKTPETKEAGYQMKFTKVPVSPAVMNLIANDVLLSTAKGVRKNVTEEEYGHLIPNFRKAQKKWRQEGYLVANVIKNGKEVPTQGFTWTKKGMDLIYEYASDTIKLQVIKETNDG